MPIEREKIAQGIDKITLNDIKLKEYDLEKILMEGYEGAERDFACYLIQRYYNKRLESWEGEPTRAHEERILVESKWWTLNNLNTQLPSLIERTNLYMLIEADQTGWYRQMEYSDLQDLLSSMMDDTDPQSSERYDWQFIVEKLVPAARSFGIEPSKLANAAHQVSKIRASVPVARSILEKHKNGELTDKQARNDLKWVIENIANPAITLPKLKPELDKYRGIVPDSEVSIEGHIYMTGDQSAVILISLKSQLELRIVEQRLKKRVDFKVADYKQFAQKALELLQLKEDEIWQNLALGSKDGSSLLEAEKQEGK